MSVPIVIQNEHSLTFSSIVKANGDRSYHPVMYAPELTTPTAKDIIKRDGYVCVVTGFEDYACPNPSPNKLRSGLRTAHILRSTIGEFDSDPNSSSFKSAATTFDILSNFSQLSAKTLDELRVGLNSPANGFSLAPDGHNTFELYLWGLKPTEQPNVYRIEIFTHHNITTRDYVNNLVSFVDNTASDSTGTTRPVDLPNPHYLAIHAAMAVVLNTSGAEKFFNELFRMYRNDAGDPPAVRCWEEMEEWMDHRMLRESVFEAFGSVRL
ncbi:hypothetical protein BJ165DRAFT_1511082, partial [Panaeolus papilionaceus]